MYKSVAYFKEGFSLPVMVKEAIDKEFLGNVYCRYIFEYYRSPEYYKSAGWRYMGVGRQCA